MQNSKRSSGVLEFSGESLAKYKNQLNSGSKKTQIEFSKEARKMDKYIVIILPLYIHYTYKN